MSYIWIPVIHQIEFKEIGMKKNARQGYYPKEGK
jgi:hypothetical protein